MFFEFTTEPRKVLHATMSSPMMCVLWDLQTLNYQA